MATEKKPNLTLNLNREIKNTIHRPKVDDTILYVPTESNSGEGLDSGVNKEELIRLGRQAKSYNSPTNIRKVWINDFYSEVEYYKSPIVKGKAEKLVYNYKFDRHLEANSILGKSIPKLSQYILRPNNPSNPVETMTFKGNVFSFIQQPWVLSNIEEIYVTYPYMLTLENLEYLASMMNDSVLGKKTVSFLSVLSEVDGPKPTQTGFYRSSIPATMIYNSCGIRDGDIKSLRAKFPRLKYAGVIFKHCGTPLYGVKSAHEISKLKPDNPNGYWLAYSAETLKSTAVSFISIFDDAEDVYKARPGIYRFDDEILLPYFERLREEKISKAAEASKQRAEERKKFEAPKNCLEADLDAMYITHREEESKIITKLLFSGMAKSTITEIFSEFTDEAQKRYSDLLGITLRR